MIFSFAETQLSSETPLKLRFQVACWHQTAIKSTFES